MLLSKNEKYGNLEHGNNMNETVVKLKYNVFKLQAL